MIKIALGAVFSRFYGVVASQGTEPSLARRLLDAPACLDCRSQPSDRAVLYEGPRSQIGQ